MVTAELRSKRYDESKGSKQQRYETIIDNVYVIMVSRVAIQTDADKTGRLASDAGPDRGPLPCAVLFYVCGQSVSSHVIPCQTEPRCLVNAPVQQQTGHPRSADRGTAKQYLASC